jgi:hypothetical protein
MSTGCPCHPVGKHGRRLLYIRNMKWADRVAANFGGETVVAAGLFQRPAFHRDPTDGLIVRWPLNEIVGTWERPRPRSGPEFTDWDPDDIGTWDERIVMVADDDFAEWQREWLADNGRSG